MTTPDERFSLIWAEGLCRCGCGQPLAKPENRFINGHDGRLMDVLVDAERAGLGLQVSQPDGSGRHSNLPPHVWAGHAFSARGVRHFEWLLSHPGEGGALFRDVETIPWEEPVESPEGALIRAARARLISVARVFADARYEGDASDVWDLLTIFDEESADPVKLAAARALLGED